jgi:hypothetical protein
MKKSDKLLLIACLFAMALFGGAHLALYAKYKRGDIVRGQDMYWKTHTKKTLPAPAWLRIQGISEVRIVPSEHFAIEFENGGTDVNEVAYPGGRVMYKMPRDEKDLTVRLRYYRSGDTLTIDGYDTAQTPTANGKPLIRQAGMIKIYCRSIPMIELKDGESTLEGEQGSPGADYSLLVRDCLLNIGEERDRIDSTERPTYFNKLTIRSAGSKLDFNAGTEIAGLQLSLDSLSSINDLESKIGTIGLQCDDRSILNLTGVNLKKLQLIKP